MEQEKEPLLVRGRGRREKTEDPNGTAKKDLSAVSSGSRGRGIRYNKAMDINTIMVSLHKSCTAPTHHTTHFFDTISYHLSHHPVPTQYPPEA